MEYDNVWWVYMVRRTIAVNNGKKKKLEYVNRVIKVGLWVANILIRRYIFWYELTKNQQYICKCFVNFFNINFTLFTKYDSNVVFIYIFNKKSSYICLGYDISKQMRLLYRFVFNLYLSSIHIDSGVGGPLQYLWYTYV